jgi:Periplasmic serine proteases (ClpP class)
MEVDKAIEVLKEAEPDRDHILVSAPVTRGLHHIVTDRIRDSRKANPAKEIATVFLTTNGGDPDGAFRIARCLRHHYPKGFRLVVPSWCKSAGTLIAIAADEIAIGDLGELGPLDIQVNKGSELFEQSSGLDIQEALGKISAHAWETFTALLQETRALGLNTSIGSTIATQVSAALTAPILAQIDPLRLGELQRAMRIANEYGSRLDKYSNNLKSNGLDRLIQGYPSHSFVIDRKEAKQIFERVTDLTEPERIFVEAAWNILRMPKQFATFVEVETENVEKVGESENVAPTTQEGAHNESSPHNSNSSGEEGANEDGVTPSPEARSGGNHNTNSNSASLCIREKASYEKGFVRVL